MQIALSAATASTTAQVMECAIMEIASVTLATMVPAVIYIRAAYTAKGFRIVMTMVCVRMGFAFAIQGGLAMLVIGTLRKKQPKNV